MKKNTRQAKKLQPLSTLQESAKNKMQENNPELQEHVLLTDVIAAVKCADRTAWNEEQSLLQQMVRSLTWMCF